MEHWQFLIQKQGDRSWIPIESPNIEIVEGRYRVLARSDLNNIDLEVRITHTSTVELPPKREIQRRSRRTNSEGLLIVIPFTDLKPGVWELCCSSDLMSHFVSQPWQHCVELEVLPLVAIEVKLEEESPVFTNELLKEEDIIEQPICPVWLKGDTAQQILQNLIEIALPDSELSLKDDKPIENFPVQTPESLLLLKLEEEIYTACWGQSLTINGRVEQKETTDLALKSLKSNDETVYGGEIRIELRSPQDSKIIRRVRQSLPEKLIPFHIRCSIEVPADCESRLILGEISLYGVLKIDGNTTLLTNQFFTITADVTELLAIRTATSKNESDTVENQLTSSAPLVSSEAKKVSTPLDLKLFNLVKTPEKAKSLLLQASPKKSLPPKINPRSHRQSTAISPQLPSFVQSQNQIISSTAVCEPSSESESLRKHSTFNQVIINRTFPYLKRLKASPDETENMTPNHESVEYQEHTTKIHNEDTAKSVVQETQFQNESFEKQTGQLAQDDTQLQEISFQEDAAKLAKDDEQLQHITQDVLFAKLVITDNSQYFITTGSPNISPLIRKWMQTQGYSLPEPIHLQNQDYDTYDTYVVASKDQVSDEANKETKRQREQADNEDKQISGQEEELFSITPSSHHP
ncbi:hypothetical protein, partial [Brasilonema sp. UFV-L1]|uniref:hypothetical protein n=1 Tax=Brasilonema sp. UFV-L1 TaxID=2234130 RepID=UPI00145F0F40